MAPSFKVVLKFIWYVLSRLLLGAVVAGLVVLSFFAAMDYMNAQTLVKDGLQLRSEVVIKGDDPTPLSKVFSKSFLEQDTQLKSSLYHPYIVSDFKYSAVVSFRVIFPWHDTVVLRVTETVTNIEAELFTSADSVSTLSEAPPSWDNAIYDVTLARYEDNWRIISMELVESLPAPTPSPTLSASPAPTETPAASSAQPTEIPPEEIIED